jgi:formate-dependent nitrite reductase membrane component NrfD
MASPAVPRPTIEKTIQAAYVELQSVESQPFSTAAFATLKDKISEYIVQLIMESIQVSKRHRADTVSAQHVEQASDDLASGVSRRFFRYVGAGGGILLGVSLAPFLSVATTNQTVQYNIPGMVVSGALALLGTFMIAFHIARE